MRESATSLEYRPFLDGLRAVAVLAVILYHLDLDAFPGGFLGVDVFFVLSGYLITSLLLNEKATAGRIDFVRFYARRVRRLLPALLVLLAVMTLAGGLVYADEIRAVIARDALASLLYVANWSFIFHGQSYFESFLDPSPLRHMWSLAVEEQFYLLWPLVVLLLPTARTRALAVVAMLAAASAILLAGLHDPADASRAYYGTDARLHEPLIGALAALLHARWKDQLAPCRLAAVPCAATIVAFFVLLGDDAGAYYRGLSVVFCAVTALLILSLEARGRQPLRTALSALPAVWVGKISYGMYLWHWPIIIALADRGPQGDGPRSAMVIALTIAISALSYHLIERPIRHARQVLGRPIRARVTLVAAAVAMVVLAVPLGLRLRSQSAPAWASDELIVTPGGNFRIAVVGDSVSKSMAAGWQRLAAERGWTLIDGSKGGCGIAGGIQVDPAGKRYRWSNRCALAFPASLDQVRAERPDIVIWQSQSELNGLLDDQDMPRYLGSEEHTRLVLRGWEDARRRLDGIPLVIIGAVPHGPRRSGDCHRIPDGCADDGSDGRMARLNGLLQAFADGHPPARYLSIERWACPHGPPCPREIDGMTVRTDGFHFSEEAALMVARAIADELRLLR